MDDCEELRPEWLNSVKNVVDAGICQFEFYVVKSKEKEVTDSEEENEAEKGPEG